VAAWRTSHRGSVARTTPTGEEAVLWLLLVLLARRHASSLLREDVLEADEKLVAVRVLDLDHVVPPPRLD